MKIASRSEPGPLSFRFVTVTVTPRAGEVLDSARIASPMQMSLNNLSDCNMLDTSSHDLRELPRPDSNTRLGFLFVQDESLLPLPVLAVIPTTK